MRPEPAGRSALVVWLQLAGLLVAVAVFGGIIFLATRSVRTGG